MLTIIPLYHVGQVLKFRQQDKVSLVQYQFVVREIRTVTCSAGTQVFYVGRTWYLRQHAYKKDVPEQSMSDKLSEYHENELVAAPVAEVK